MRSLALALALGLAAAARAEDVPLKLSPLRVELLAAVEEFHAAERRLHRGGPVDDERHELKHQYRYWRKRVQRIKRQILKDERRSDDYYRDDPYPTHLRDPETGDAFKFRPR